MTDKTPDKPDKPPAPKPAPKTGHKGPPAHKADHAAFKRGDRFISKPMRIKR